MNRLSAVSSVAPWSSRASAVLLILCAACSSGDAVSGASAAAAGAALETRSNNGAGFLPAFAGQTRAPALKSGFDPRVTVIASGLKGAWAFEFLPDGRILLSERAGNLRIIDRAGQVSIPLGGLPRVVTNGQGGLLDIALDPQFTRNHIIYWSYAEPREGGNGTTLAKGVLFEQNGIARVDQAQVIFRQLPTLASSLHFGSRILFGTDGKLYLGLGERSIPQGRVQAQSLDSHLGKLVRLNPDGSVPQDNPFVGRSGAKPEIWSWGHRNIQAMALDPAGALWLIEHGPRGGDELNRVQRGRNYGWPVITYGIEYTGPKIGDGITVRTGLEQPAYYWDPVIAPSGMIFYTGTMFPEWQGDIFVGGLGSQKLVRLRLRDGKVAGEEWLLQDRRSRIRDVQQGPDGALYVVTESADGQLLRLSR
ncbi:MAG: PQQ-dependent sugar dehydrogenase [Gammaproteobacteria bacterium]|nr:PQQ-dependent sugar dehydrogenase [Gammaproteobacteria bacterium]